jgi:hypothetical protein
MKQAEAWSPEEQLAWEKARHLQWRALAKNWEDSLRKAREEIAFLRKVNYDLVTENKRLMGQSAAPVSKKSPGGIYIP